MFFILFLVVATASDHIGVIDNRLSQRQCDEIVHLLRAPGLPWKVRISQDPTWFEWDKIFFHVFHRGLQSYLKPYNVVVRHDLGYTGFRLTRENGTIAPYFESNMTAAGVLFLQNGGNWWFPNQKDREIEPKCGRLLLYPISYTHSHGIRQSDESYFVMTYFVA